MGVLRPSLSQRITAGCAGSCFGKPKPKKESPRFLFRSKVRDLSDFFRNLKQRKPVPSALTHGKRVRLIPYQLLQVIMT
jgi:hypothetical protein